MRAYQIGTLIILSLGMVTAFQNCGQSGMQSSKILPSGESEKSLQSMRTLIDNLNQEDLTCAQDSDCEALPVGERGCGGPETYIVVSKLGSQYSQLISLVDLYKDKVHAQLLSETDRVSTCLAVLPPEARCVSNSCAAVYNR